MFVPVHTQKSWLVYYYLLLLQTVSLSQSKEEVKWTVIKIENIGLMWKAREESFYQIKGIQEIVSSASFGRITSFSLQY